MLKEKSIIFVCIIGLLTAEPGWSQQVKSAEKPTLFPSSAAQQSSDSVPQIDFSTYLVVQFRNADHNDDGILTQAEIAATEIQHFNQLDQDRNGRINIAEFVTKPPSGLHASTAAAWRSGRRRQFLLLDQDRSGEIIVQEFTDQVRRAAARADNDGDGLISLDEFSYSISQASLNQINAAAGQTIRHVFDQDQDGQVTRMELLAELKSRFTQADSDGDQLLVLRELFSDTVPVENDRQHFIKRDVNGDNALTVQEFTAGWQPIFTNLDRDRNGILTPSELTSGGF